LRRYEIFLPRRFNDGHLVPEGFGVEIFLELRERFGAASCETQVNRAASRPGEAIFGDDPVRMFADVSDTAEHMQFFKRLKERLKGRFKQLEILIISYPIHAV